jgi:hypothetical protein
MDTSLAIFMIDVPWPLLKPVLCSLAVPAYRELAVLLPVLVLVLLPILVPGTVTG